MAMTTMFGKTIAVIGKKIYLIQIKEFACYISPKLITTIRAMS